MDNGPAGGGDTGPVKTGMLGFLAGFTSTLAHAAGPVLQMYLLPQQLSKLHFAGTTAAFFFLLNLIKLVPFALLGRLETGNLLLAGCMLPTSIVLMVRAFDAPEAYSEFPSRRGASSSVDL